MLLKPELRKTETAIRMLQRNRGAILPCSYAEDRLAVQTQGRGALVASESNHPFMLREAERFAEYQQHDKPAKGAAFREVRS